MNQDAPAKRGRGRPPKLTPELTKAICDQLQIGMTLKAACAYAGANYGSVLNWQTRFSDFRDALKSAEAACMAFNLAVVQRAATKGSWQAAIALLERRFPKDFARRTTIDIEARLRERAIQEGLDPDEVVEIAESIIRGE